MATIDEVIAAAKLKAAESGTNLPATTDTGNNAVAVNTPSAGFTTDAFLDSGGMSVESYLNVTEFGVRLNKDWKGFVDDFEAQINLKDVAYFMGIQRTVGKQVDYAKTYNGVTEARGTPWSQITAEFKATSDKPASEYRGADVPMVLTKPVTDPKEPKNTFDVGTCVGLTTSITAFKPWQAFHKKLRDSGLKDSLVTVRVKHVPRKNAAGQGYGILDYELISVDDE